MQHIKLQLEHHNFFCPVTGIQIMSEEEFIPSTALVFCYIDDQFIFVSNETKTVLSSMGFDIDVEPYVDQDDFEALVKKLTSCGFVLFEIIHEGIACGPISNTTYFCIDMNFKSIH